MGAARLLAKGWLLVCLYAGAHALRFTILGGGNLAATVPHVLIAVALFAAMGLLFVGGYGASSDAFQHHTATIKERKLAIALPDFNDAVLFLFAALTFAEQVWWTPLHITGPVIDGLERAVRFAVPGHDVIVNRLGQCGLDGGRVFSSAFAWLLAFVFAASAISRLRQAADAVRLDRVLHPHSLSLLALAGALGVIAIIGIQCLFVGSVLSLLPCAAFTGIPGSLLIGLAPLMLAYVIHVVFAILLASGNNNA